MAMGVLSTGSSRTRQHRARTEFADASRPSRREQRARSRSTSDEPVLATYNVKGGVGKTSAAVNLARLAAEGGARTLLWDLDPQGASTYLFRVKPKVKGGGTKLVAARATSTRCSRAPTTRAWTCCPRTSPTATWTSRWTAPSSPTAA